MTEAEKALSGSKILVVDDSRTVRQHLGQLLSEDFSCFFASDAESALTKALEISPELIISDVVMEPFDGHELCRRIRHQPSLQDVPFILLTSSPTSDGRALGLEEGADDYLCKPVQSRELFARVRSLIRLRCAQKEILRQKQKVDAAHQELLTAQKQLLESEKLAMLGTISAGVAHEINNPLSVAMSGVRELASLARTRSHSDSRSALAPSPEEIETVEHDIETSLTRIKSVVDSLGLMALEFEVTPLIIDVRGELERALAIAAPRLSGIKIQQDLSEACGLRITPGMLTQVLLSLINNSVDAVAATEGPRINLSVRADGHGIELLIEDNGCGIPPEVLPRIFEPFFTTKPAGHGMGLGLSVCYGIVRRLGGTLTASSERSKGAKFRIWIPERPRESLDHFGTFYPASFGQ